MVSTDSNQTFQMQRCLHMWYFSQGHQRSKLQRYLAATLYWLSREQSCFTIGWTAVSYIELLSLTSLNSTSVGSLTVFRSVGQVISLCAASVCNINIGIRGHILRKENLNNLHTDKAFVLNRTFVQWCGKGQLLFSKIPQVVFKHVFHRLEQLLQAHAGCSTTSFRNAAA